MVLVGIECADLWRINHQLNYLFMTSSSVPGWQGHMATYIAPLPWRHRLEFFGSYVRTRLSERRGWGAQGVGKYQVPFWIYDSKQQASVGYAFRRSNNVFDFGFTTSQMFDISQFILSYETTIDKPLGKTTLCLDVILSPGNMTPFNKDSDFSAIRTGADSNYIYGRASLDQLFSLPRNCSWFTHILFQQSTGPLLPTEELSLGGYSTVRGYEENAVIGDNGLLFKNEWRTPPLALPSKGNASHELQGLLFNDLGWSYDVDQSILDENTALLSSLGVGIRYHFAQYVSIRFDYGWQLTTIDRLVDNASYHSRAHFGAILAF